MGHYRRGSPYCSVPIWHLKKTHTKKQTISDLAVRQKISSFLCLTVQTLSSMSLACLNMSALTVSVIASGEPRVPSSPSVMEWCKLMMLPFRRSGRDLDLWSSCERVCRPSVWSLASAVKKVLVKPF